MADPLLQDLPEDIQAKALPAWEDVADKYKEAFPGIPPEYIQQRYEQAQKMRSARLAAAATGGENQQDFLQRRAIPIVSAVAKPFEARQYQEAQRRVESGDATDDDYHAVARYDERQRQSAERMKTWGGAIGEGAAHLPALVGEAMLGGQVMKGAAAVAPRALGWMAPKALEEGAKVAVPQWVGGAIGRNAVQTALMPSMYVETWTKDNMEHGRDPLDIKGFPAAFGLGMANNAILGSLGNNLQGLAKVPGLAGLKALEGEGVKAFAGRQIAKGLLGVGEQAGVDVATGGIQDLARKVIPEWTAKETHYGTIGDLVSGKYGDAARSATTQALTFGLFGMWHEAQHGTPSQNRQMTAYQSALKEMGKRGVSAEKAGVVLNQAVEALSSEMEANPGLGRADARKVAEGLPEGPVRDFGLALAESFPEKTKPTPPPEPTAPSGPQAAPPEPPPAQGGPTPGQPPPVPPQAPPARKASPVDAMTFADWKKLAKGLGVPTGGLNRKGIFDVVRKSVGNDALLTQMADQIVNPPPPKEQPKQKAANYGAKEPPDLTAAVETQPGASVREVTPEEQARQQEADQSMKEREQAKHEAFLRSGGKLPPTPEQAKETPPAPVETADPKVRLAEIVREVYPEARTDDPAFRRQIVVETNGRRLVADIGDILEDGTPTAQIDFHWPEGEGANYEIGQKVSPGTMGFLRQLQELLGKLKEAGYRVGYAAEPGRQRMYKRAFERAGFELVEQPEHPDPEIDSSYTWAAKKTTPGQAVSAPAATIPQEVVKPELEAGSKAVAQEGTAPLRIKPDKINPKPGEPGPSRYEMYQGSKKVGYMEVGHAGGDSKVARRMFPEQVGAEDKVSRIFGIEVKDKLHGQGLGQMTYLGSMIQHGADWYYNSQTEPGASRALMALARKGLIELHWARKAEPGVFEGGSGSGAGGIHLVRVTEAGRKAFAERSGEPPVATIPQEVVKPSEAERPPYAEGMLPPLEGPEVPPYRKEVSTDVDLTKAAGELSGLVVPYKVLSEKGGKAQIEQAKVDPLESKVQVPRRQLERLLSDIWDRGYVMGDYAPENLTLSRGRLQVLDLDSFEPREGSGFKSFQEVLDGARKYYGWESATIPQEVVKPEPAKPVDRVRKVLAPVSEDDSTSIRDLRKQMPDLPREQLDAALLSLSEKGELFLLPDNRAMQLSPQERGELLSVKHGDETTYFHSVGRTEALKSTQEVVKPEPAKPVERRKEGSKEAVLHDQVEKVVEESDTGKPEEVLEILNRQRRRKGERQLSSDEVLDALDSLKEQDRIHFDEGAWYKTIPDEPTKGSAQLQEIFDKAKLTKMQRSELQDYQDGLIQEEIGAKRGVTRAAVSASMIKALAKMEALGGDLPDSMRDLITRIKEQNKPQGKEGQAVPTEELTHTRKTAEKQAGVKSGELNKLEDQLDALAEKVKKQGGKWTDADRRRHEQLSKAVEGEDTPEERRAAKKPVPAEQPPGAGAEAEVTARRDATDAGATAAEGQQPEEVAGRGAATPAEAVSEQVLSAVTRAFNDAGGDVSPERGKGIDPEKLRLAAGSLAGKELGKEEFGKALEQLKAEGMNVPGVAEAVKPPEGMGAAGGSQMLPPPPPGTPGAAAPNLSGPNPVGPASSWFKSAADWFKSAGQKAFPALTRLSQPAGEKLAEAANAPAAAKASWEYFSRILKVGGKALGDLTPEERRAVGAVWLERRMRHYREYLKEKGLDSSKVGTLIGQEGSPLQTEADYQQGHEGMWSFWETIKQEWTPEVEKNFMDLLGIEEADGIKSPSQIPGLPLNAIAVPEADPKLGVVSTGKRQGMENLRLKKPGFAKEAGLDAPAYDLDIQHMMERTLNLGIPAGRRAEFARTAIADGVMQKVTGKEKPNEGWQYLGLDPVGGLPGLEPNARYYVHPDAYKDVVQGLGIGKRPGQTVAEGFRPVTDKLYSFSLMSPVELSTHTANHLTALFRPGMGIPFWNLKDTFANAYRILTKEPEILRRVMELAKIGAAFEHEPRPGFLGEKLQKYDPTWYINRFTSKFIDVMQKSMRVQLETAFDSQVKAGFMKGGETQKRDFINSALGNYNSQASNRLTQFLKDTGLQSFATAAWTFTTQGAKQALGGAINAPAAGAKEALQLRATAMLKLLPVLAIGPVVNYLRWGQAFPTDIPSFAVKTRDDEEGKLHFFDPLKLTGIRRGWRATGINAMIEGGRAGESSGKMADHAVRDLLLTGEHMLAGPPAQFAHTLATGENALGHRVAEKVPAAGQSQQHGGPRPGSSQFWENLKATAAGVNPIISSMTEKTKSVRTLGERLMQSAGPFGETTRDKKKKAGAR